MYTYISVAVESDEEENIEEQNIHHDDVNENNLQGNLFRRWYIQQYFN